MPDLNPTDQTIYRRFPYPVAAAWRRVRLAQADTERISHLIACNEVLLRTLASVLFPDYLRGSRDPSVEAAIRKLDRPTAGNWMELVRELIRSLGGRQNPPPFISEAQSWFFTPSGKPSKAARGLEEAIRLRNEIIHGPPSGASRARERVASLAQELRSVLFGMGWLAGYRPFRVLSAEPTRRRAFAGLVQFFVGAEERTDPQPGEWDVFLVKDAVYLTNPDGSRLLELAPFVEVLPDPRTAQEHLYVISAAPGLRHILMAHEESGSEIKKAVDTEQGQVPFELWLSRHEGSCHKLSAPSEVFRDSALYRSGDEGLPARYEIVQELGRGGMAIVYLVRDRELGDEETALKVLKAELAAEEAFRIRFRREAADMKKVRHPCIVPVTDIGALEDGRLFLKMPVLRKGSLQEQIIPGGLVDGRVRGWAENALDALECVHRAGIIHRDVKPSNFLLDDDGRALLTDFGIALKAEESRLTRTLEQLGTVAYMAPEQRAHRNVTPKTDIYSLAIVLHELLTGELPKELPGAGIGGDFGTLIRHMGAPEPEDRPTASRALEKLRRISSSHGVAEESQRRSSHKTQQPSNCAMTAHPAMLAPPPASPDVAAKRVPATGIHQIPLEVPEAPRDERRRKFAAIGLLIGIFAFNFLETKYETPIRKAHDPQATLEGYLGDAATWFERGISFEQHDATGSLAVYGFSIVYFFVFPLLALAAVLAFALRRGARALRLLAASAAIDYLLTLPFYVLFPVPERWSFPESNAVLLSDLWTSKLIQAFRPFSGLTHCFPSFHISATVIIIVCFYRQRLPFRAGVFLAGIAIALSTFALGIHWISDIIAGVGAGLLSVALAERWLARARSAPPQVDPAA